MSPICSQVYNDPEDAVQSIFMLAAWFFSATQCTFPHLVPWLYVIDSLTHSSQLARIGYGVTENLPSN